eukprot:7391688-Prymnesium_polylepis.3
MRVVLVTLCAAAQAEVKHSIKLHRLRADCRIGCACHPLTRTHAPNRCTACPSPTSSARADAAGAPARATRSSAATAIVTPTTASPRPRKKASSGGSSS